MKPRIFPLFASTTRRFHASSTIVLACVSLFGSAALSQAGVLWSLDFNSYADGNIENTPVAQPGFPGNWFDGAATVTTGVVTSGNSKADMNQTFSAAVGATGTLWLSYDWGHNNTGDHANTYGGLSFFESNYPVLTEKGLIGNTWDNPYWNTTSVSNIGMKTGVAKITLSASGADTVELWVGPTGSPVDVSGSPMATLSMELSNVNCVRVNGGNAQTFDNLVIGEFMGDVDATVPAAPPASGIWANTAGGLWDTTGNWSGDIVATGSGSTADFSTLNIPADTTVNLNSARTIGNLVFGDTDTSSAASWTLANNATPANTLTLSGATPTITVNSLGVAKTVTISTAVAGSSGLAKSGPGTLILTAANSYGGATTVSEGTLQVIGQRYFNVGRTTTVASGAVLELNDSNNSFTTLMPTSTVAGAGTFRLSGNSTINQSENGVNGTRLTFEMQAGGLIDLQGTSRLVNGGWQVMNWTNNLADMNIASGATLDVWDGQDVIIDALTGSGTVDKVHPGNSPRLLTVGVANGSGAFSGTIQNTAGQLAVTKVGSGTQTLSGTIGYSGNTTVQEGTLSIGSGGSPTTLSDSATVSIAFGAAMNLNFTGNDTVGALDINGSGPLPAGTYNSSHPEYGSYFIGSGSLVVPATATAYEIWGAPYGLAAGSEGGDLDNDGLTNFEEYAFGLIPNIGASVNPITAQLNKTTGTFSYTRRDLFLQDPVLSYTVWYSTDLVTWFEDTGAVEGTTSINGEVETVPVTISASLLTNTKLFIQVRAN